MSLRSTTRRLLAAAVATSLLAATPALAKPADEGAREAPRAITHAPPVTQSPQAPPVTRSQDLRGEFARDSSWPTPAQIAAAAPTPAQPAKALPVATDDGRAQTWLIVLVGLAGAAIAAGGTAGVRSHHRHA